VFARRSDCRAIDLGWHIDQGEIAPFHVGS